MFVHFHIILSCWHSLPMLTGPISPPKSLPFKKKTFKKKTINQKFNHTDFLRQNTSVVLIAQHLSKREMPLNTRSPVAILSTCNQRVLRKQTFLIKIRVGQNGSQNFLSRSCWVKLNKLKLSLPDIFLPSYLWLNLMLSPRASEQDKMSLFLLFSLFSLFQWIWGFSTNHQDCLSFWLWICMLPADHFSSHCLSAPEFWKQEKLYSEGRRSQSSPGDAFSKPWPLSGHDHSAHQRGGRGWAACVWTWLLFCGGAWGCDDWNNHTDHFCQGPRCVQQLNQVFP